MEGGDVAPLSFGASVKLLYGTLWRNVVFDVLVGGMRMITSCGRLPRRKCTKAFLMRRGLPVLWCFAYDTK